MYNPMGNLDKPSLAEMITIKMMKKYQRWPVPETLMNRAGGSSFVLRIDSIITEAYNVESMQ